MSILITVADKSHISCAISICKMMEDAAKIRGTGIAKREVPYIQKKILEGKAIIALDQANIVGFCYIESWEGQKYVANSGLIIHPDYRHSGLARLIKKETFSLSKKLYPNAKLFGITTSLAVMKINSDLGYQPVTFSELTQDEVFWNGCKTCVNYDILQRTNKKMCLCTGMVCDLSKVKDQPTTEDKVSSWNTFKQFFNIRKERWKKYFPNFSKQKINHEK
ncbi:MAG: GNAT family N-acetyltransferase [Flavobacteriales bacterium]|nr:GNAT family N-acetyltransferase [Flavobacteriales bacterium]MCB9363368.1 GNAT family N-acetyltransferase [Flavobacteriales bacterium]